MIDYLNGITTAISASPEVRYCHLISKAKSAIVTLAVCIAFENVARHFSRSAYRKLLVRRWPVGWRDAGYTDQTWTSDFTDPVYRMKIMNGFSLILPA